MLQDRDPELSDIVPRLDGYWGDNCGVHFVGEPTAEMARIHAAVIETLVQGIAAIRRGIVPRDLDALLRTVIRAPGFEPHAHHFGHGVGVSTH